MLLKIEDKFLKPFPASTRSSESFQEMVCLAETGHKLPINVDFKEEGTRTLIGVFATAFIHYFLDKFVFTPIANYVLAPKKNKKGKVSEADLRSFANLKQKFNTSAWKFVSYAFFVAYGIYALKDEGSWFWEPKVYHYCFPNNTIPFLLRLYYNMATAYYIYTSFAIFFEPKMKDRNEMMLHHAVTLSLLVTSFLGNVTKYGLAILLLHDVADPLMEVAKMFFYTNVKWMSNIFFIAFASTFIYLRVYVFPRFIIWTIYTHERREEYDFYWPTLLCLTTLWILHIFWSYLILRVLTESVLGDGKKGDVREEDD